MCTQLLLHFLDHIRPVELTIRMFCVDCHTLEKMPFFSKMITNDGSVAWWGYRPVKRCPPHQAAAWIKVYMADGRRHMSPAGIIYVRPLCAVA